MPRHASRFRTTFHLLPPLATKGGPRCSAFSRRSASRRTQRGLWFRHGEFQRVLAPGRYRIPCWLRARRDEVQVVSTLATRFEHPLLDVLLTHNEVRDHLLVVDNNDAERALVWRDERHRVRAGPGPLRVLDGAGPAARRAVRRAELPVRAPAAAERPGPPGRRPVAGRRHGGQHRGRRCSTATASSSRRCGRACTSTGGARARSPGGRSTAASRWPTSRARRSSRPTRCRSG